MRRRSVTPRERVDRSVREDDFARMFTEAATACGWVLQAHWPDSRWISEGGKGFPDWVLGKPARNGQPARVLFAELKRVGEKPSPYQVAWIALLQEAGCEAYCWTIQDWDTITAVLQRKG